MRFLLSNIFLFFGLMASGQSMPTLFEQSGGRQSPTYHQVIDWWKKLDAASPYIQMKAMGPTDAGFPLHLVLVSKDGNFNISSGPKQQKAVILVNNGIHPGEPDGIDASMLLVRDMIQKKIPFPDNVILAIIPVYNIGGALNRSLNYRIDQNGPEVKGFRGNSQNLDLNRDFIKCDSKEALSFSKIFHYLDPDVFIDNHVSNGADYQHVMTLLSTQHNKLGGVAGEYLNKTFEPALYAAMKGRGWDLVPYVNHFGETPEKGWPEFWDSPRYSSGYAALWNTFSFVPETHMLKPYLQRVAATRDLMLCFLEFTSAHVKEIKEKRAAAQRAQSEQQRFPIAWKWDRTSWTDIVFKGYEATYKPSDISGLPRLYYNRARPFERTIPFYNVYVDTAAITKPKAYIIPAGWWKVIERLQANGVQMRQLKSDTQLRAEWYRIESYQSGQRPYEGHHLNSAVQVSVHSQAFTISKGDWYIPLNQPAARFLVETLEPQGEDSYFAWNFFDPVLGQKEGFSDYVFEETAFQYLKAHPELKARLEARKATDTAFAKNGRAQLNFIYQNSPYYEPAHQRYPVLRVP
jgi:hypothetical protein